MVDAFPRGTALPTQSALFWVTHKDRYLRQLLIRDIQADTGRKLVVYFTDTDRTTLQIDPTDDVYLTELLRACAGSPIDLFLETNGGLTDAAEKVCTLLRTLTADLRVIVPRRAKSNGTLIALCGNEILMSPTSELGPVDPSVTNVPAEFIVTAPPGAFPPMVVSIAAHAIEQTKTLTTKLLSTGMLKGKDANFIGDLVAKLSSRNHYHSHGAVIDADEAASIGLNIRNLSIDDPLAQKCWLLRTMYSYDCAAKGYGKIFEGEQVSSAVTWQPPPVGGQRNP